MPKIWVEFAGPPVGADRDEPRVFDLLVAPHQGQRRAVAGKQLLGQQAHAVNVKQRAVGVEQDGLGGFGAGGGEGMGGIHDPILLRT